MRIGFNPYERARMRWVLTLWLVAAVLCLVAVVLVALALSRVARAQAATNRELGPVISLAGALSASSPVFSADIQNSLAHEARCVVNITSITGNLTVTMYGKDAAAGQYYTLLASAALSSTGQTVLEVGPGLTVASNLVANDFVPPTWRVGAAISSGPVTATVSCSEVE
jgi:hypothetical protein